MAILEVLEPWKPPAYTVEPALATPLVHWSFGALVLWSPGPFPGPLASWSIGQYMSILVKNTRCAKTKRYPIALVLASLSECPSLMRQWGV